ncbi:MAG: helix-turn-helix domain-containing protein [Nitrososphaerales archaeon]
MNSTYSNKYEPDFVSPPGDTLFEVLEQRQMSQSQFADRVGHTPKYVSEVIKGKAPITAEAAISFEKVLGIPCSFWNNRQRNYDLFIAKLSEFEKNSKQLSWADNFPYGEMSRRGWVPIERDSVKRLTFLLNFFGVATPEAWSTIWRGLQVSYRRSIASRADHYALFAWLRRGQLEAQVLDCSEYDEVRFRDSLREIRSLTLQEPRNFQSKLVNICLSCGVAVAFVQELPNTASGATSWLSPSKALLQLSLRYKRDDSLWFTFFHEAAHIILHQKRVTFLEGLNIESAQEAEADKFAADVLIPPSEYKDFLTTTRISKSAIVAFAQRINIAPGVVVGRLQHDRILPHSHCNILKRKLRWAN